MRARHLARDPAAARGQRAHRAGLDAIARRRSDLAVQRHRCLQRDEGSLVPDVLGKRFIQLTRLRFVESFVNFDSGSLKPRNTASRDYGIRVAHRNHDLLNAGSNNGVGARPGSTYMRAWLQVQVKRSPVRPLASRLDRQYLCVLYSIVGVDAAAYDFAFWRNQHRANAGIRRSQGDTATGKLQRLLHKACFVRLRRHLQLNRDSTKSVALKGNRSPIFSPTPT